MTHDFKIVEKKNTLAVHALCHSRESAERWIENIRNQLSRGVNYFMDKSLTADSFAIIAPKWESRK